MPYDPENLPVTWLRLNRRCKTNTDLWVRKDPADDIPEVIACIAPGCKDQKDCILKEKNQLLFMVRNEATLLPHAIGVLCEVQVLEKGRLIFKKAGEDFCRVVIFVSPALRTTRKISRRVRPSFKDHVIRVKRLKYNDSPNVGVKCCVARDPALDVAEWLELQANEKPLSKLLGQDKLSEFYLECYLKAVHP